jgi:hypothetical protein
MKPIVDKDLSDMFSIKKGLKQGDDLSLMLLNFPLKYGIKRVHVNQDGLKLNGTHQLLVFADNVNILGRRIHNIKKNTEALVVASKLIKLSAWSCIKIRIQDKVMI